MDKGTKQILEIVTDMQENMPSMRGTMSTLATKEDLRQLRLDLQSQITENTKAIAALTEQMRTVFGYAKEYRHVDVANFRY